MTRTCFLIKVFADAHDGGCQGDLCQLLASRTLFGTGGKRQDGSSEITQVMFDVV